MIIEDKIQITDYKCFDSENGFERILPINIIIGRNNSGKSSLINLVEFLVNPNREFGINSRKGKDAKVFIYHEISKEESEETMRLLKQISGLEDTDIFETRFSGETDAE